VLAKVRELVLPGIERHGAIEAWIIDDTGFGIRSGLHGNIAVSWASKTIVRLP